MTILLDNVFFAEWNRSRSKGRKAVIVGEKNKHYDGSLFTSHGNKNIGGIRFIFREMVHVIAAMNRHFLILAHIFYFIMRFHML